MATKDKAVKGFKHMWYQPPLSVRIAKAALVYISLFVVALPFAIGTYALVTL